MNFIKCELIQGKVYALDESGKLYRISIDREGLPRIELMEVVSYHLKYKLCEPTLLLRKEWLNQ